jgi:hypothetical protein
VAGQVASKYQLQRSCKNVFHGFNNEEVQTHYSSHRIFNLPEDHGKKTTYISQSYIDKFSGWHSFHRLKAGKVNHNFLTFYTVLLCFARYFFTVDKDFLRTLFVHASDILPVCFPSIRTKHEESTKRVRSKVEEMNIRPC